MLRPTLVLLGLLALGCGMLKSKPEYSEEIVGREDYHPPEPASVAPVGGASGGQAGSDPAEATAGGTASVGCDATFPAPVRGAPTDQLQCGGSVTGTTEGGSSSFGDEFYQRAFCTPARRHYDDAPEAIYRLEVPADTQATVTLDSPCAELDLAAVAWALDGIPTTAQVNRVRECEMDTHGGGGKLTLTAVDKAQVFLVVVDGQEGAAGPFRLEAACGTYR